MKPARRHPSSTRIEPAVRGLLTTATLAALVVLLGTACGADSPLGAPPRATGPDASASSRPASEGAMTPALRAAYIAAVQASASADHHFAATGSGRVRASSAAQRLAAQVGADGVKVSAERGPALGLRLAGFGRRGALRALPCSEHPPRASANRATLDHLSGVNGGGVAEHFTTGPLGVEQAWQIATAPEPQAPDAPVVLRLEVSGLVPVLSADGSSVSLQTPEGDPALKYTDLLARDAEGKALPATMTVEAAAIVIAVDDAGARYPLYVDPLISTQQGKWIAGDGAAEDLFGLAVSLSGDTAVVGAPSHAVGASVYQGSAYVFVRSGSIWTEQAKLKASDGAAGDFFGLSVSISGDTVVVGADEDVVGANYLQGSAYVFVRSGSSWTEQAKLTASDGAASDLFGWSVSVFGDTVVVGAMEDDVGANGDQGSAYVFVRSGTSWTQQAKLTSSDGAADDQFGCSVSVSGDTAVVGALFDDVGANAEQGSAYVFVRSGTSWTQQAKLTAGDGADGDIFGRKVSTSGDTAVVGAELDDVGANKNQGSTYIFVRSGSTWTEQAKLTASDGAANDYFGGSVSVFDDAVVIGAFGDDVGANYGQGSAYVFVRSGSTWTERAKLTASDGAASDTLGNSVSLSGDTVVVGAPSDDVGAKDQGSAYPFRLSAPNGDTCTAGLPCSSGFCVDGVCCDTACGSGDTNDCQACSVAAGASSNGTCGPRANAAACNDGLFCNGADTCQAGTCSAHAGDPCAGNVGDADSDCSESCDEAGDSCTANDPASSSCTDGVACNGADSCSAGNCSTHATTCGTGGTAGTGGASTGGAAGSADAGGASTGGTSSGGASSGGASSGGASAGGTAGSGGSASGSSDDEGGCGCKLDPVRRSLGGELALLIALAGLVAMRRRASARRVNGRTALTRWCPPRAGGNTKAGA
ncbi:MAG: hypothetical protein IT377_34265 [Polyangiaceae bacterium]|nr:hypothetical protein [Polyangiaceae bacterium]